MRNEKKPRPFHIIILFIKDSLQQEIHFYGNIFGNECCRLMLYSLYIILNEFIFLLYQVLTSHVLETIDFCKKLIVLGFNTTRQPLWVILCRLPEKGKRDNGGDEREGQGRVK